jgi:hypothetical protein
MYLSLEEVMVH